jgi:hypothetical protein
MRISLATGCGRTAWTGAVLLLTLWLLAWLVAHAAARSPRSVSRARVLLGGQTFVVDVVDTPALQSRGLGGRARLGPGEGMLFVYPDKGRRTFWMRGMLIAIDIIWLDNNRIIHIERRVPPPAPGTSPEQLPTYVSPEPANGVLEIAAGRATELGIRVGHYVRMVFD